MTGACEAVHLGDLQLSFVECNVSLRSASGTELADVLTSCGAGCAASAGKAATRGGA